MQRSNYVNPIFLERYFVHTFLWHCWRSLPLFLISKRLTKEEGRKL